MGIPITPSSLPTLHPVPKAIPPNPLGTRREDRLKIVLDAVHKTINDPYFNPDSYAHSGGQAYIDLLIRYPEEWAGGNVHVLAEWIKNEITVVVGEENEDHRELKPEAKVWVAELIQWSYARYDPSHIFTALCRMAAIEVFKKWAVARNAPTLDVEPIASAKSEGVSVGGLKPRSTNAKMNDLYKKVVEKKVEGSTPNPV